MRMLKFPKEDYLYHWTKGLADRGDMIEVNLEVVKGEKIPMPEIETITIEEAPTIKKGRPKKTSD